MLFLSYNEETESIHLFLSFIVTTGTNKIILKGFYGPCSISNLCIVGLALASFKFVLRNT